MSDLTQLVRGKLTPADFFLKQVAALKSLIGKPATDEALSKAEDEIKALKIKLEEAIDGYLRDKLPTGAAGIAEAISDGALNALQAALLAVAQKAQEDEQ